MARKRTEKLDFRGDLQSEIMSAVWQLGEAKVEDVRQLQPANRRSAYTTLQTVMTRLAERGLLERELRGTAYYYRARYDEADFLSKTIADRLAGATPAARKAALVNLVEDLGADELDEVARYANRVRRQRNKP